MGASTATVGPTGFEQFDSMARMITAQVVDDKHRDRLVGCHPQSADKPDDECAGKVLSEIGLRLFRRPLSKEELDSEKMIARKIAAASGNFYAGLNLAIAKMLETPEFLFRIDRTEADPDHPGQQRLDAFSRASRLSFFLWNAGPDDELLKAAEGGDLYRTSGVQRQVARMISSPRIVSGIRAFFSDMLGFQAFESLEKDGSIYPAFAGGVADAAKEQTLLTVVDHLITRHEDYRDLFTTRRTFMNRALGPIYYVPVRKKDGWEPYEFPADDPREGLLTEVSFSSLYAHPGRSSATLRGKAIREVFLCQKVPAPPANVNFTIVQNTDNPDYKTARSRLTAHRTAPACAGCHKIMDPIGLSLETFDGAGQYRTTENGVAIDASGELDGMRFSDAAGLGKAMHDDLATTACLVSDYYRYAFGRDAPGSDRAWIGWLQSAFAADGYRIPELLRRIATSKAFLSSTAPQTPNEQADSGRPATFTQQE